MGALAARYDSPPTAPAGRGADGAAGQGGNPVAEVRREVERAAAEEEAAARGQEEERLARLRRRGFHGFTGFH